MRRLPAAIRWMSGRARVRGFVLSTFILVTLAAGALAAATGKIQGKIVAADDGEPIGFADVVLLPADTTMYPVGGRTNADGTFLLEAAPGTYVLQIRALSYAKKRVEGIVIESGKLLPFSTTLGAEAIQQQEVVVEARAKTNTESSMLAARKKAVSVGDAVSAEQVRKSPDKNAAEVLRRVTGLNVADGKYVYVRGLGERYSSTDVDGVRIASPEQNKRVVPLDLFPASLLDNIVVQKTYTADRPGEFGGGDVQVHTRDFPGARLWSFSISQEYVGNTTFKDHSTYASPNADLFGFGASGRGLPGAVDEAGAGQPLVAGSPPYGFPKSTLASVANSFANIWSPAGSGTVPNGTYSATYGDELKLFGRSLGIIASSNFTRTFANLTESQRSFQGGTDTLYDYAVTRSLETAQLGAITALSYRLSPQHSLHLRGLYTNSADDEVRVYQGQDHNRVEATTGQWIEHRDTRLLYVQRDVLSGTLEGRDEFRSLAGLNVDWNLNRSSARRQQPDRREVTYDKGYYYDGTGNLIEYWGLGSTGSREFGDLNDNGWGEKISGAVPYRLGGHGAGKVVLGFDHQSKKRESTYRRFDFYANQNADPTAVPESLFDATGFNGKSGTGYVEEGTLPQDNYHATSDVMASFLSADVPFAKRLRGTFGVRVEHGTQDVASYELFHPTVITSEGSVDNTDWLPTGNITWSATDQVNLRLAASRTLSRPDLNELSPSPTLEYVAGYRQAGNPNLHRALIDNYDARLEAFPSASEVFAAGFFYKYLKEPIEQAIQGAVPPLLVPLNSDHGHNLGGEFEMRSALGRYWGRMKRLSLNTNVTVISSKVVLKPQLTPLSAQEHPLQGQAAYVVNAGMTYATTSGRTDVSVLFSSAGERLRTVGYLQPDIYDQPTTSLDATANTTPLPRLHLKFSAKNLLNHAVRQTQGGKEVSSITYGRSFSIALAYGS
jgi:outer membrane receptor protein involved in Fe transport